MPFQIKVVSGPSAGQTVPVDPSFPTVIGRDPTAQLGVQADHTLSRQHAQVAFDGSAWVLRNLSQHGTLLAGEVFRDQRPIYPGTQFTAGATTFVFEEVPAGAAMPMGAAPMPGAPMPMGGAPMPGAPAPVPAGAGAQPAAAGGGALAAGAAGALGKLPSGPAVLPPNKPGEYPLKELIMGGVGIAKANLVPSLVVFGPIVALGLIGAVAGFVIPAALAMIFSLVMSLLNLVLALAMPLVMSNYVAGVKRFQETGQAIAIGDLFKVQDLVNRYVVCFAIGLGSACYLVPGALLSFALPIIIENPGVGFANALKGSLAYGKKFLVPTAIFYLVLGVAGGLGMVGCIVGIAFTMPAMLAAHFLAYTMKRDEIKAAAAEGGIAL
jgi:hypothetical protein